MRRLRRVPEREQRGMCVSGLGRIPPERTTVRTPRGASTRSAHRHYERSPQVGLRAGRRAESESRQRGEVRERGENAPWSLTVPRTGSAEVGVEKRRGGRRRRRLKNVT